jgi:hypothetical protein
MGPFLRKFIQYDFTICGLIFLYDRPNFLAELAQEDWRDLAAVIISGSCLFIMSLRTVRTECLDEGGRKGPYNTSLVASISACSVCSALKKVLQVHCEMVFNLCFSS